ncbi:MAG: bifunctional ADP-dependent NAD(P)H-hydrate dehydratase/NAD(P)H-hydrate epimerase, partial [Bacteroidales bacterium]|nr:bifunctional ADP-dependent NAD(P)H-hydrate dehydratase/NAD(P)H-hydrate epimerase [Bacteroidales bacterium]
MTSVNISYLKGILHRREPSAHKGDFGRGLLIAGCREMCGAAILAARASLRSGIGLLHVHASASIYDCLQAAVPEAMVQRDARHNDHFADEQLSIEKFDAVALGPGLGQGP